MPASDLVSALRPVVAALQRLGIRHFIGGSVASSIHGVVRTTVDVDVVAELKESSVDALIHQIATDYYVSVQAARMAVVHEGCFNLIHLPTSFKIDMFVLKSRPFDQQALERSLADTVGDEEAIHTRIASPEDVILNKLEWYRLGNEMSQRQWQDVIGVLKVQRHGLDFGYLERWAGELGVSDLLRRARQEI